MTTSETAKTATRLAATVLRDFKAVRPGESPSYDVPSFVLTLSSEEAPIPVLLRHTLDLIGIPHAGPGEKVAWSSSFIFKGYGASLAHQKFGLRLRVRGDLTQGAADALLSEMRSKLTAAVPAVERLLSRGARDTLNAGDVTVVNQHGQLRRAYAYFRGRAEHPDVVEDVSTTEQTPYGSWSSFLSGKNVMALNSFHDLVAAISAFLSSLEHDLVLALPFVGFDPMTDDLTQVIGDRWGKKWGRVIGHSDQEGVRLRERLTGVVERWRNPYSHGGFEKGLGATLYLHTEGIGALPMGLSEIRDSPLFSFHPASEADIGDVFVLFDEIDDYFARRLPHASDWISSGLDVRFDKAFRKEVLETIARDGELAKVIRTHEYYVDMAMNMDY